MVDIDFVYNQDVFAKLKFIIPQDKKPTYKSSALTGGAPEVFFQTEYRSVNIKDIRSVYNFFSLETNGFSLLKNKTNVKNFYDDDAIETTYKDEIEILLQKTTGAKEVFIFDYTRRSDSNDGGAENPDGKREPADRVHVDYTETSGPKRAIEIIGKNKFEECVKKKYRISQINVWRPIAGPVKRSPIAFADALSISSNDLVATDQIFPDRIGEIYHLLHSDLHKWFWVSNMNIDEVLLLKGWDSLDDGRARYTPHGSFKLPNHADCLSPRESIEVRAFLVYHDQK